MVASTAAAGGMTATRMSSSVGSDVRDLRALAGPRGCASAACVRSSLRSAARKLSSSMPKSSIAGDHDQRADDRGPHHEAADRIPFDARRAGRRRAAPAARDSRATRPAGRCRSGRR